MENPFKNIRLKHWPDYWLALTGPCLIIFLGALVANAEIPGNTVTWVILFSGMFIFGIGAQVAHYKIHLKGLEGNANVWISKWRHSFLANIFAVVGLSLILCAAAIFLVYFEICP